MISTFFTFSLILLFCFSKVLIVLLSPHAWVNQNRLTFWEDGRQVWDIVDANSMLPSGPLPPPPSLSIWVRGNNCYGFENICVHSVFVTTAGKGGFSISVLACLLLPNFCLPCLWGKYPTSASLFWPLITRLFSTIGIQLYITTVSPQVVEFWDGREQV